VSADCESCTCHPDRPGCVEPPLTYDPDAHSGTWQPGPAPRVLRATLCARHARQLWPGPVGDQLSDYLEEWATGGWRYDHRGRGLALMADLEKRHNDMILGRTR
jgi:hypothetical protein